MHQFPTEFPLGPLQIVPKIHLAICSLKVHKHEIFFLTFFAETETLWSQGPVTRDF